MNEDELGMNMSVHEEHIERVKLAIEPILGEDQAPETHELADRAAYSRFHFHRVFKRIMGETPGDMRRRLLLERAAYRLLKTEESVTSAGFDAGFESVEGFSRAFRRGFGTAPGQYRSSGRPTFWLAAPNDVHYMPLSSMTLGGPNMDLIDRLIDHDLWLTKLLLEKAKSFTDEQLDAPLPVPSKPVPFEGEQRSIRDVFDMMITEKEVWVAAVEKQPVEWTKDKSIDGLIARVEVAYPMFHGLVRRVRDAKEWDATFVDELCVPPVTFTFGGMIAHVLNFGTYRRQLLMETMRGLGVKDIGYGDPLEWEQGIFMPECS